MIADPWPELSNEAPDEPWWADFGFTERPEWAEEYDERDEDEEV